MTTTAAVSPLHRLRTYASFVRFEHTLFSLPLILAGVFCVPGPSMSAARWALVVVAAVGARTAAMVLNRLIDRRLDALNPRTRTRELPAGKMKTAEALALLLASILAYGLACAALGPWFLSVAPIPLAVFTIYPYLKRFTPLCHFGVGLALALAPLAGYAAAHPDLAAPEAALGLATFAFFWVSGFDMIYATLDEAFDQTHGVHSMVAWLGRQRALGVSAMLHLLAFLALVVAAQATLVSAAAHVLVARSGPSALHFGAAPLVTALVLAIAGTLLFLEQRWAENVNLAFFKVNVCVGFVVLATVLAARLAGF